MDELLGSVGIRIFEVATRQHGLLRSVESYRAKFLPVADSRVLDNQLVYCQFPLQHILVNNTSRLMCMSPYVSHMLDGDIDQLRKLLVSPKDLARPPPEAGGYGHRRKNPVVLEQ